MTNNGLPLLVGRDKELELLLACLKGRAQPADRRTGGCGEDRLAQEAARAMNRPTIRVDGDERYSEEKLTGWFDPPAVFPAAMF